MQSKKDGGFYAGFTHDLKLRFEQHEKGRVESTRPRRPFQLVYYEACESQVWIEFARRCGYLGAEVCDKLNAVYDQIMGQIVKMIDDSDKWLNK